MSSARPRIGRSYTRARRHPWVLGKLGDWTLPLGPYTPAQLVVAFGGAFLLIKTYALWSFLGPIPVVAWGAAIWAVRSARIGGRTPGAAAWGAAAFAAQPPGGRVGGRPAKDRGPKVMGGGFVIEETSVRGLRLATAAAVRNRGARAAQAPKASRPVGAWIRRRAQRTRGFHLGLCRRVHTPAAQRRAAAQAAPAPTALQQMIRAAENRGQ